MAEDSSVTNPLTPMVQAMETPLNLLCKLCDQTYYDEAVSIVFDRLCYSMIYRKDCLDLFQHPISIQAATTISNNNDVNNDMTAAKVVMVLKRLLDGGQSMEVIRWL